ncbi:MAG TPA: hypothetical protein PK544_06480 [Spirochaetota bacterium]|nr:hypothetical protein [Spirochaetota bacterium]HPJ37015.1 hypothetical protein [Spirochaetota bacterium]HPQ53558.1 hypothetical protein [Spirochaetota bacterium]
MKINCCENRKMLHLLVLRGKLKNLPPDSSDAAALQEEIHSLERELGLA